MNLEAIANGQEIELSAVRSDEELIGEIQAHLNRAGFTTTEKYGLWGDTTQMAFNRFVVANQIHRSNWFTPQIARTLLEAPTVTRLL